MVLLRDSDAAAGSVACPLCLGLFVAEVVRTLACAVPARLLLLLLVALLLLPNPASPLGLQHSCSSSGVPIYPDHVWLNVRMKSTVGCTGLSALLLADMMSAEACNPLLMDPG